MHILCISNFFKNRGSSFTISRKKKLPSHYLNLVISGTIFMTCHWQKLFCLNMCYSVYLNLLSIAWHLINYSLPQECLWLNEKLTILTLPLDLQSLGFGRGPSQPSLLNLSFYCIHPFQSMVYCVYYDWCLGRSMGLPFSVV